MFPILKLTFLAFILNFLPTVDYTKILSKIGSRDLIKIAFKNRPVLLKYAFQ